jgi:hypothetical protein
MSQIEYIPDDDDSDDDGDRLPRAPAMSPDQVERCLAALEEMGGTDHIDIETLEAELRFREKIRKERAFRALDRHPTGEATEAEMVEYLRQAGAFDGLEEDTYQTQVLHLIRIARQRRN